jgi:AcrR family transcriptional regulator
MFMTKSSKMIHTAMVTTSGEVEVSAGSGRSEPPNRLQRRKQRTRAALVKAAQQLIAEGRVNVPILEITQAADVGMGSFYNHFDSKEQLFEAAIADVLDAHGALLDRLTASIEDAAEIFATSFRLTGRLFRQRPQESEILLANGLALLSSERGLAPRALRDIKAAADAGRFHKAVGDDPELALAMAGGALLGLGTLLREDRNRDGAHAADTVTENVLCLFGLSADEAHSLCQRPLPALDAWGELSPSVG